ncbi:DUF6415 family natural product biosynthesis protein [Streptomyces sp. NPDC058405]|uniref:DUF6415 family natural product biosynthesis protein n=1 Tax=Streptomyces sp. NPDC058405 TaxID=3346482 RepID=UPI003668A7A7
MVNPAAPHEPCPDTLPFDLTLMMDTARRLVDSDARLSAEDLETAQLRMRGSLALLIPEAEARFGRLAPVGVEEAGRRLDAGPALLGPMRHVHCLARSVLTLCTHLSPGEVGSTPMPQEALG